MKVAVVIPCYKVSKSIASVLSSIPEFVEKIYVVDDACPEKTGDFVLKAANDKRIEVIFMETNLGVGGAVMNGYESALKAGFDIIAKIDGDGQMDPGLLAYFIEPIESGRADYTKGNRFYFLEGLRSMPKVRLLGNAALSLVSKFSSGYWNIFDPTNGFTCIHREALSLVPLQKVSKGYFFESDVLFRLNTIRAVVVDIPMQSRYLDETSNLKVFRSIFEFSFKHARNLCKRIFYNYYLRDMSAASIELPLGMFFLLFGGGFGLIKLVNNIADEVVAAPGTVMLAALPAILGLQLMLAFLAFDVSSVPKTPIQNIKSWKKDKP